MVVHDRDDFDPRYSRHPMTFSDAVAALFRSRPRKLQGSDGSNTIDGGGLELVGAKGSACESAEAEQHPPVDTSHAA